MNHLNFPGPDPVQGACIGHAVLMLQLIHSSSITAGAGMSSAIFEDDNYLLLHSGRQTVDCEISFHSEAVEIQGQVSENLVLHSFSLDRISGRTCFTCYPHGMEKVRIIPSERLYSKQAYRFQKVAVSSEVLSHIDVLMRHFIFVHAPTFSESCNMHGIRVPTLYACPVLAYLGWDAVVRLTNSPDSLTRGFAFLGNVNDKKTQKIKAFCWYSRITCLCSSFPQ